MVNKSPWCVSWNTQEGEKPKYKIFLGEKKKSPPSLVNHKVLITVQRLATRVYQGDSAPARGRPGKACQWLPVAVGGSESGHVGSKLTQQFTGCMLIQVT